ncbi:hypothetical protein ACFSHR_24305 [Azotobacter chroococcum]
MPLPIGSARPWRGPPTYKSYLTQGADQPGRVSINLAEIVAEFKNSASSDTYCLRKSFDMNVNMKTMKLILAMTVFASAATAMAETNNADPRSQTL